MQVPLADVVAENALVRAQIDAAIARVLDSNQFILGAEVATFEQALANAVGRVHAVGVSSGTDALLLSLMALGIGPGDEVITSPFTFFATAGAIARLGATPVFADIDPITLNLDPSAAEAAITGRTRAIIPVSLFGYSAQVRGSSGLPVVVDAAQTIGAPPPPCLCATHSFFPAKNLGACGDAGAVVTDDADFADRLRLLRTHGARPKYVHHAIGGNFRLDALQAAILGAKLPYLEARTAARQRCAQRYYQLFEQRAATVPLALPPHDDGHVYNQFVVRAARRDLLQEQLKAAGIGTAVYYPQPLHLQACFSRLGYQPGSLPEAERACGEVLALPMHPTLSAEQQEYVVEQVARFYE